MRVVATATEFLLVGMAMSKSSAVANRDSKNWDIKLLTAPG